MKMTPKKIIDFIKSEKQKGNDNPKVYFGGIRHFVEISEMEIPFNSDGTPNSKSTYLVFTVALETHDDDYFEYYSQRPARAAKIRFIRTKRRQPTT